jgi:hypothetical protein
VDGTSGGFEGGLVFNCRDFVRMFGVHGLRGELEGFGRVKGGALGRTK